MLTPASMSPRSDGAQATTALPTSCRLAETLRAHDVKGEKAMAFAQGAICLFVLALYSLGRGTTAPPIVFSWVVAALAILIASSMLRWWLASRPELPERALDGVNVIEIAIILSLLWSDQYVAAHAQGSNLKVPSFVLLLVLVALRALRFHPRPVLIAGAVTVVGWSLLMGGAVLNDGMSTVAHDYYSSLVSLHVLFHSDVEKVAVLGAFAVFLGVATYSARQVLGQSVYVADYADALEAARHNLEEATRAKERAEGALVELSRSKADLVEQNRRFNTALANMRLGLSMFDEAERLLVCNDRFLEMYALSKSLAAPGTPFDVILKAAIGNGQFPSEQSSDYHFQKVQQRARMKEPVTEVQEMSDGRTIIVMHQPMAEGGWVATHEDVTPLRRIEARMSHMARHDGLTDLPNRKLLSERVEELLAGARGKGSLVVLVIDIDRFKEVNDSLGPAAGDALLKVFAHRLGRWLGGIEMIARVGADEFAVLQLSEKPVEAAAALVRNVQNALGVSFELDGHKVIVSTTMGVAIGPADGSSADQLLKHADLALNRAKREAPGSSRFFERSMDEKMQARHLLECDLRAAINKGQLELYYQPRLDLATNAITGFEALLRWNHPERGLISPIEFISLAEETGLIVPIGEWVLREACSEASTWRRGLKVSVNLSSVQFRLGNVRHAVIAALGASRLSPYNLELEVTESVMLEENPEVVATLNKLRELGIAIAIDDFGTGYSGLSYLRRFNFDQIKIDQMFIRQVFEETGTALAIVRAIIALGRSLGIPTTAEGVETEEQLELVRREGCAEAQGYLIGKPSRAKEISAILSRAPRAMADHTSSTG